MVKTMLKVVKNLPTLEDYKLATTISPEPKKVIKIVIIER